jgi:hypothetical protein
MTGQSANMPGIMENPSSPSPSALLPWPKAASVPPWRERAAMRLAVLQSTAAIPVPQYAGNPINVQRHMFGEDAATLEASRINAEITTPPTTTASPQMIWPRSLAIFGR